SDADGPDPRPYAYDLKPGEAEQYRKKMLDLATIDVRARAQQLAAGAVGSAPPAHSTSRPGKPLASSKPQPPTFDDAQLRVFDLSNSNEPVLVLTAKTHLSMQATAQAGFGPETQYFVTLVARSDLYGTL